MEQNDVIAKRRALAHVLYQIAIKKLKADLSSYRYYLQQIDSNLDHIQELHSLSTKVTVTYRDTPTSGGRRSDKTDIVDNFMELEKKVKADSEKLRNEYIRVRYMIDSLNNFRDRQVLQGKYINGYTWSQISDRIYIEERWVRRIHNRAVRRLLRKLTLLSPPLRIL